MMDTNNNNNNNGIIDNKMDIDSDNNSGYSIKGKEKIANIDSNINNTVNNNNDNDRRNEASSSTNNNNDRRNEASSSTNNNNSDFQEIRRPKNINYLDKYIKKNKSRICPCRKNYCMKTKNICKTCNDRFNMRARRAEEAEMPEIKALKQIKSLVREQSRRIKRIKTSVDRGISEVVDSQFKLINYREDWASSVSQAYDIWMAINHQESTDGFRNRFMNELNSGFRRG